MSLSNVSSPPPPSTPPPSTSPSTPPFASTPSSAHTGRVLYAIDREHALAVVEGVLQEEFEHYRLLAARCERLAIRIAVLQATMRHLSRP